MNNEQFAVVVFTDLNCNRVKYVAGPFNSRDEAVIATDKMGSPLIYAVANLVTPEQSIRKNNEQQR